MRRHRDRATWPRRVRGRRPLIACLWLLAACSGTPDSSDTGTGCPNDLPADCPADVPDYNADVAPIIADRCLSCHSPGGAGEAGHDFTTWDTLNAQQTTVLTQVYACKMPPEGAPPLTSAERGTLLDWLVCGAPGD